MNDRTPLLPLGELVDSTRGISYGIVQPGTDTPDGVPLLRVKNIRNGRIDTNDILRVAPAVAASYERTKLRGGELLLTLVGTVGETAIVPPELSGWNTARAVAVIPVKPDPGPRWIQYALASRDARERILQRLNTTVQATLNLRDVAALPIPLPPAPRRRDVLEILGTLDDKIEVNRRMNETLEGMARALFKSWFVDFDPVRAKMEGRAPQGMDADTAALFPDSFQDSELGPIPKGWSVTSVSSYADLNPEVWRKSTAPAEVSYLDLANVKWGEVGEAAVLPFSAAPSRARRVLREGDTIIGTVRPGNGSFGYIETPQAGLTGSTGFAVLRPVDQAWREFVYLLLTKRDYIEYLAVVADGSAYPAVDPSIVAHTLFVAPPQPVLTRFSEMASRLLSLSGVNRRRSRTLAQLRDTLLPKLLSGELRVPEAEEIAKSA